MNEFVFVAKMHCCLQSPKHENWMSSCYWQTAGFCHFLSTKPQM